MTVTTALRLEALSLEFTGDPIGDLRVPELRVANATLSRTVGRSVDVAEEITSATELRWDAMAHVAWVLAKRTHPEAPLGLFTGARAGELSDLLRPRHPAPRTDTAADTEEAPADPPTMADVQELAAQDPTEPTG